MIRKLLFGDGTKTDNQDLNNRKGTVRRGGVVSGICGLLCHSLNEVQRLRGSS